MKLQEVKIFVTFFIVATLLGIGLSLSFYFLSLKLPVILNMIGIATLCFLIAKSIWNNRYKASAPFFLKIIFSIPSWLSWIFMIAGLLIFLPKIIQEIFLPPTIQEKSLLWIFLLAFSFLLTVAFFVKKILLPKQKLKTESPLLDSSLQESK